MSRKVPDNYIAVKARVAKFCAEHGEKGSILTEVIVYPDQSSALIKAVVKISGEARASAHSLADLSIDKGLEKGETVAVGRALEFVGYASTETDLSSETDESADDTAPAASRFDKTEKTQNTSRFSKALPKSDSKSVEEVEETEEEETQAPQEQLAKESKPTEKVTVTSEEVKQPVKTPTAAAGTSKMADLMAKYGSTRTTSTTATLRR